MKSFLFAFSALALLAMTKSLPCIGDSCGRLLPFYSEYEDDDGLFYIREGSYNSASSNDDEEPQKEITLGYLSPLFKQQHEQQPPIRQRPSYNYQQSVGPNSPGQGLFYQSNQQPSNPPTSYGENQETQYTQNPDQNNQGNYNSGNQGGNGGHYQNNDAGSNGYYPGSGHLGAGGDNYQDNGSGYNRNYPGSGHQDAGGDNYQNNGSGYNGNYPGSGNHGGGGGYYQNNGGSYGRYLYRHSTYASDFGNGDYNKNIINIEK